ncbi:MAG: molybdate ABC transporter substrate-binding protein [Planctomycetota bacterium]|nr:molybdate ABC transporter substrate-binding protein [Planctomycetota bacterium]
MRGPTLAALLSLVLLGFLVWNLWPESPPGPGDDRDTELVLFCAAGIRKPVTELAQEYERRYGVRITPQFGGSGTMLSALQATLEADRPGDLYLAAEQSFIETAREKGLVAEVFPLAEMRLVIGVATGNPHGIQGLEDLTRAGLRLGIGEPDATAIGRVSRALLREAGAWDAVLAQRKVAHPTVSALATDLEVGALDAALIWDSTAFQFEGVDAVRVPAFEASPRTVQLGVLQASPHATAAIRFARFLASDDVGQPVFQKHGFHPTPGDAWVESPRLELMCGAMLNAAVDATLREFAEREGIVIDFKYNGCGLLVDEMLARGDGAAPDVYFSCDQTFLDLVQPRFGSGVTVSSNPIVIVTQAGNPRGISRLQDLAAEGLRVGLAHPEKSALGALTQGLLAAEGIPADLGGNVKLESPTGDTLVNQLRTGSLDAVVVYTSNAARARDAVTRVPLALPGARASQPFAIAHDSPHQQLVARLLAALTSAESRGRFEELGFRWELGE